MNPTLPRRSLLAAGATALLAACSPQPAPTPAGTKVTVGLTYIPNVQFSPFYLAVADGIFADLGLHVALRHHGAQEDMFGALQAGTEQVVFGSSDEAVVAAANVEGLGTFATAYQQYPAVVIVPADSPIRTLADLRGRTVGIPGHFGSTYYAALAALHTGGLATADVTLQDIGFTQVSALAAGKLDAVVGYANNEAVQFDTTGLAVRLLPVTDAAAPQLVGPGLMTVAGTVPDDVLRKLADGMKRAEQAIAADPQRGVDATVAHVPTLSDEVQRTSAEAVLAATAKLWTKPGGEIAVDVDPAAFERMGAFMVAAGILPTAPQGTVIEL